MRASSTQRLPGQKQRSDSGLKVGGVGQPCRWCQVGYKQTSKAHQRACPVLWACGHLQHAFHTLRPSGQTDLRRHVRRADTGNPASSPGASTVRGVCAEADNLFSHNCPFRRPAHLLPRGRKWTPRTPTSARARIRAPSLSPSGRKPPERGTATKETRPCRTSAPRKELTKLVLRQADTLSLPAAGPGLHGVSQDLHEAWAIVTDLEVGGSNQPQRDLANHADALHDRGPPGASGIPCGERQRSPSPRATGTSRGRKFLYLKWNPNTRSHEKTDRDQHCPGEGIPRPDQAEPPLPEGHPAVPCATPADRNHDGGHRSFRRNFRPRDPQALPRSPPDLHCDGEAQLQCGVAPGRPPYARASWA